MQIQEDYGGVWSKNDYWVAVGVMDDSIGIETQIGSSA